MVRIIFIGWGVQNSEIIKVDREATAPLKGRVSLTKAKDNFQKLSISSPSLRHNHIHGKTHPDSGTADSGFSIL